MIKKYWWLTVILAVVIIGVIIGGLYLTGNADWVVKVVYHPGRANNPQAEDVSFAELMDFLEYCEYIEYSPDYVCRHYAKALHDGAETEGIRAAIVIARAGEEGWHTFNAFETTDCGIIYVDPWRGCYWGRYDTRSLYDARCRELYNLIGEAIVAQNGDWFVGGIMFYPLGSKPPESVFSYEWEALRNEEGYIIRW